MMVRWLILSEDLVEGSVVTYRITVSRYTVCVSGTSTILDELAISVGYGRGNDSEKTVHCICFSASVVCNDRPLLQQRGKLSY